MLSYPGCHVRAKYIGCIGTQAHWSSSDVIVIYVKVTLSKHVASGVFRNFWEPFLKNKMWFNGEQEKEPIIRVRVG